MKEKGKLIRTRLSQFAVDACELTNSFPSDFFHENLAKQLIRSSSSAFLNYGEADGASSVRDFINKLRLSLKEMNESLNNLILIKLKNQCRNPILLDELCQEATELCKMLYTSIKTASNNLK